MNGGDKGKKLIFDVKKSMKWEDVKNLILPNVAYKNDKMIFDKWDKEFPADGDKVAEATYTAVFKNNPGIEVPPTPDQPTPTGKVRITLDATDDGHFTEKNGNNGPFTEIYPQAIDHLIAESGRKRLDSAFEACRRLGRSCPSIQKNCQREIL